LPEFLRLLRPLQYLVWALLLLLIAALPLVSWRYGAGPHMLAVFVAYYLVLLAALLLVFLRRTQLGLSNRAFGGLMFDVCACAPFGVNLVSKLTLRRSLAVDSLHGELQAATSQAQEAQA
jgi:GB virus C genotype envelope